MHFPRLPRQNRASEERHRQSGEEPEVDTGCSRMEASAYR